MAVQSRGVRLWNKIQGSYNILKKCVVFQSSIIWHKHKKTCKVTEKCDLYSDR